MKRQPGRRAATALLAAALALTATACAKEEEPKKYPGAFPRGHTDVSAEQAFRDHGVVKPASARDLGYNAWSADDSYPLTAVFTIGCTGAPGFAAANGLRGVPELSPDTVAVEVFAKDHGWTDTGSGDTRYLREKSANGSRLEVLVHASGEECRVYLKS